MNMMEHQALPKTAEPLQSYYSPISYGRENYGGPPRRKPISSWQITICHQEMTVMQLRIEIIQVPQKPGIMLHDLETMHTMIMVILFRLNIPLENIVIRMAMVRPVVEIILNIQVEVLTEIQFRDMMRGPLMVHHLHKGLGCLMVEEAAIIITIHKIDIAEVGELLKTLR
ncbi:RBMY1E isoform 3 [Pan troglodytes]|uniref:RBMY1E isoform 1 n=1 Tax=Pan troglodytes TaxID=9598 RepID=A0A2J8PWE6_PANTR|nr:RBMY1E isoform 1 [Pan troglodytes]PNI88346.1 RBMY1E isoform 3 [Pan troglodytes]